MTQPLTNIQQPYQQNPYPQQGGANAVSINIYNPQAYGGTPAQSLAPQQVPYNYTNSFYQMPQVNAYQQPQQIPEVYQQYIPTAPMQYPTAPVQSPIAPAPQIMPESVMTPAQPQAAATEAAKTPEVVNEAPQTSSVDIDALVKGLADSDADKKAQTINKIAEYAQSEPSIALEVVSEPLMNGLINVINEDTTGLEGPTDKQIEIAEKITKGEKLTPEEDALSEQLSPRDKANKNRIFALYTLAMIQKLQREELNQYIENQKANGETPIAPLKIEELPGYSDITNIIKNDPRPEVKVAAMQALQYIAEPTDKAAVESALSESLNSQDEVVKAAAQEVLDRFGTGEQAEAEKTEEKK